MRVVRGAIAATVFATMAAGSAMPASAQFYLKSRDYSGAPVQGDEPGVMLPLAGATGVERRAALVWTMRAALNVAALQCDFAPTLATVSHYNALLRDHRKELDESWTTLGRYFARTAGKPVPGVRSKMAVGESAREHFQTQTYSSFSTIAAQMNFCQTASEVGRDALFTPVGQFGSLAETRIREVRNSLTPYGEQGFTPYAFYDRSVLPRFDVACWSKKGEWVTKKCGAQNWPPAGQGVAAR